jgi:hypothetical protein
MDMTPPQAPPALTRNVVQEATQAFDRLVGLQAWLATEQSAVPSLPEVGDASALTPYLGQLDSYWSASPTTATDATSRRAAFAARVVAAARDLAVLAHEDGNLDDDALALAHTVISADTTGVPAHLDVRELTFGDAAYAGVLLIRDQSKSPRTLAFSAERGWEVFPDLSAVHEAMEQRARLALVARPDLPGIARQHLTDIAFDRFVGSRELTGLPFATLVGRMIDVQRDKVQQAWFEAALVRSGDRYASPSVDAAFEALRLDQAFDVAGILAVRHAALLERFNAQRLARVPIDVAETWQETEDTYRSTMNAVATAEEQAGLATAPSLAEYAAQSLRERLRGLGINHDPADIEVRIDRVDPTARLESLQTLFDGPAPVNVRLIDLAYQNIATFDAARFSAFASDGTPIAALDNTAIRDLVRDLDLASSYRAHIDATFRSGPQAAMRREHAADVQSSHMAFQAAEARLGYYLDDAPPSFNPDHAERGYRWVRAALDAPVAARRARVEGHEIVVRQVTYQGTPLRDLIIFGARNPASVRSIVVYTPGAPDGITFREFEDRAEAGRRFLYHPAFREYLLDRLPSEYARILPNGSARAFAGDHLAQWVLGASDTAAYTRTAARFEEREIEGDFLEAAFHTDVQLGLRNTQTLTRSAEEANWAWMVESLQTVTHNRLITEGIMSVVTAPARAAQAGWRFYDTVKTGDGAQAFVDFADFYNASLAAAAPYQAVGAAPLARSIVAGRFRVAGRLVEARPAVLPTVVFEQRFAATGVRKAGRPNREGIFAIDGKTYIEHADRLYAVRFDTDYGSWRLTRPQAGATFRGPAIQRTPGGHWTYHRIGLRGGSGRGGVGATHRPPDVFNEYVHEIERAFPDPFERDLVRTQMRGELAGDVPAATITAAQRLRWTEALGRAYQSSRRVAERNLVSPPMAVGIPHDMALPRIPAAPAAPPGYRPVALADVPGELWYYGSKPFKNSPLVRKSAAPGFSPYWAQIRSEVISYGTNGIRVTTVPPTASIGEIQAATGLPLTRSSAFAVSIRPRGMLTVTSSERIPRADLLVADNGPAGTYVLRPTEGAQLTLGGQEHTVVSKLP